MMKFLCSWFQLWDCLKRVNSPLSLHILFFWVTRVFYLTQYIVSEVLLGPKAMEILEEDQRIRRDKTEGAEGIHLCGSMKAELIRQWLMT